MKFYLDTKNYESIKVSMSKKDNDMNLIDNINEFCFAMASFFSQYIEI